MTDITALGEVLIDFACQSVDDTGYPTLAAHPGGAPGNLLAAAAACGCKTAMIGKVGEDAFGRLQVDTLQKSGIDPSGVVVDPKVFTTLAFVTLDAAGNRSFSFARKPGADTCLTWEEVNTALIDTCRDFHFGTLSLTTQPSRAATQKAVGYAKGKGKTISFDPNLRKPLWEDLEEAKEMILWGLSQADIVKISDEETEFLWGDITPEDAAQKLRGMGVTVSFVTLGPKGAYFSGPAGAGYVEVPAGVKPVDTTGAGDIFGGSALAKLLQRGRSLKELTAEDLRRAAAYACYAASLSTQSYGGISSVPSRDAVRLLMPGRP